ncbi:MAG: PQQ-dependent sugar dehydrogenase, partial [Pedosphaera sp.]|nr:PQQ-dependent sugar dehydrogenase [Pedosphaera sp.]
MRSLLTGLLFASLSIHAARVPWVDSKFHGTPEPPPAYKLERVFPNLTFTNPVELTWAPELDRFMMVELGTKIHLFENKAGVTETTLLLDLKSVKPEVTRVYSIALHPQFAKNQRGFVVYNYTKPGPQKLGTRISEFKISSGKTVRIDLTSEKEIITWRGGGHNGCSLRFGPDGFLYISTGDAEAPSPPDSLNTGQDISDLLGSILRIDVDGRSEGKNYRVPADNPFREIKNARSEVWAYGLRNPWRMSFDPANGDLWVGDVGWESLEMIYKVQRGGNYGWSIMEGSQTVKPNGVRGPSPILAPTVEHPHTEALSITGGYVYHGKALPKLRGAYIYGDYVTGKIWGLRHDRRLTWQEELVDTPLRIICFGVDAAQELYVVDYGGGIYRLAQNSQVDTAVQFPQRLSETGLFADTKTLTPKPGVIQYDINAKGWFDNATSTRLVAIPERTRIDLFEKTDAYKGYLKNTFKFPEGSVIAKTVSLEMERGNPKSAHRLETQILHRHNDEWRPYNYVWNEEQTDATLAPKEGHNRVFEIKDPASPGGTRKQTWRHASRAECTQCHNNRSANLLAFNPPQLDHNGQIEKMQAWDWFAKPLPKKQPEIADPYDQSSPLHTRARTYLQLNCAHCHRRGGGGTSVFEARIELDLASTKMVNHPPTQGDLGIKGAMIVLGGDPYRSTLYNRMARLGPGRMPRFGSTVVDEAGLALMREWIQAFPHNGVEPTQIRHADDIKNVNAGKIAGVNDLLKKPNTALLLADALTGENLEQLNIREALGQALQKTDPNIRDLFRRFDQRQTDNRLGPTPSAADILAQQGNALRGKKVFFRATTLCSTCHRLEDQGREFGPDLSRIG